MPPIATPTSEISKPSKPSTEKMVTTAIKSLNERTGSSVQAITKFIVSNFNSIDEKKTRTFIKKYLKKAVNDGTLVQTKGTGATGSFKISEKAIKAKAAELKLKNKNKKSLTETAKKQTQLDGQKKIQKKILKNTEKKIIKNDIKKPKSVKPKEIQVVAKLSKLSVEENTADELAASDVENNNITLKGAAKSKNQATKLVRKSISILNTAAQRKIKPTKKDKTELAEPTAEVKIASAESEANPSVPAKIKRKKIVKIK